MKCPRTVCPAKIYKRTIQNFTKKGAKRPTATLNELQEYLTNTDYSLFATTISQMLQVSGLQDGQKLFLTKIPTKSPQTIWQNARKFINTT